MDDTQQSRTSDAAAAATRKRRSSILKSQRPARTPFSELEFNVTTPTDTAKSRRVSFSKLTGVAEYVTNEATTTWKNFYEEQNKSLESSGNDSNENAPRQPLGHLGKRTFDQQFEEVTAVDFISSLNPASNANGSINNVNFTQQLASLECTSDGKLTAPYNKFDLSAFTDQQSKLFGNDFTVPCVSEMSGRIDVNFSAMHQVGEKDDLDQIQRDIARASNNMACHQPFSGHNMSEYIEVDLNMTHVASRNGEDMSLTDTVHSPVRDISQSCSIDKKVCLNKDWAADKENIAINPYAAPKESINFALNDEPDQVLVFDGKRLTLQSDKVDNNKKDYRKTLLPNSSGETSQRKCIVLNMNDDLPNFVEDMLNSKCENSGFSMQDMKSSTVYNDLDISMTLPVNRVDIVPKKKSIHDNTGNMSMTHVLPTNIICGRPDIDEPKSDNRTIVYEENTGNISVTQPLSGKIITNAAKYPERRRTVVYEDDTGNISITQCVPTNILVNENSEGSEKRKTIVFDDDQGNISVTQAISSNIILADNVSEKRNTIFFDDDGGNVSITQAVPANIVLSDRQLQEKRRTIIYEDDTGNISVTQAIPTNIILDQSEKIVAVPERRRTVVYENCSGNISVTQALPSNILLERNQLDGDKDKNESGNIPITQSLPTNIILKDSDVNKRRTIVYEDDTGNISITQAIPTQIIPGYSEEKINATSIAVDEPTKINTSNKPTNSKRRTIIYENDDLSMTEAIPNNIILPEEGTSKRKTMFFYNENADISMTRPNPANVFLLDKLDSAADQSIKIPEDIVEVNEKVTDYDNYEQDAPMMDVSHERRTIVVVHADNYDTKMSITATIPKVQNLIQESEKRRNIVFDSDSGNILMTKPIPAELLAFQNEILNKSRNKELDVTEQVPVATSDVMNPCSDLIVYQTTTTSSTPMLQNRIAKGDSKSDGKDESPSKIINDPDDNSISFQDSVQTEVTSEDQSLIHPPIEVKSDKMNLKPSNIEMEIDVLVPDVVVHREEETLGIKDPLFIDTPKESVLNTLLDMSVSSMESGTVDQNVMAQIESNVDKEDTDNASSESMFYITRDSDEEAQTDREGDTKEKRKSITSNELPKILDRSPLSLEFKEKDTVIVDDLEKRLAELKTVVDEDKNTSYNKLYENTSSPNLEGVVERDENVKLRQQSITFRRANDTKELLDMISDFTDKKDEEELSPVKVKGHMAIENKSEVIEPRRLSFAPNRKSIVLSREDLLNNISMAQAVLQKSRLELDDSDCLEEDTRDESMDQSLSKKPGRTSNEVVKTLHFDDESLSETSIKSDTKVSPLKKTAFGETSYMTESKAKVIPTYLKDVSDGIKELMMDLVKPMADTMPFEAGGVDKGVRKAPSTQSTQIQANLLTSSQIDIDSELYSNPESGYDVDKMSSLTGEALNKSRSRSFRSPVKFSTNSSEKSSEFEVPSPRQRYLYSRVPEEPPSPARVLVFDHLNPLNNILIGSMDYSGAHKYNPKKSDETLCGSERSHSALIHFDPNTRDNDYDMDPVTTQYRMETQLSQAKKGDDPCVYKQDDNQSNSSTISKPLSIDQSIDVKVMELKDIEVNTLIAMKGNKELLEASSSLTLVDDAVGHSVVDAESRTNSQDDGSSGHHRVKISRSPVEIIYKIEEQGTVTEIPESDFTSHDELIMLEHAKKCTKGKKRVYSPAGDKYRLTQPLDVTPKPTTKMQKISNSPNVYRTEMQPQEPTQMAPEKDVTVHSEHVIEGKGRTSKVHEKKKSPRKAKEKKPGTNITVQQLITEYHMDGGKQNVLDKQILNTLNPKYDPSTTPASQSDELECNSLEVVSSFTSSKNLNAMSVVRSTSTTRSQQSQQSTVPSKPSRVDWHPELISALSSNLSESDSRINVVAKIDMLPFMGSHECEWESSSVDTWSFRLLHGRLRLAARLAHRHDNSTRTRVRGDTPVLDVTVETVQHDKKNPVATLCVRFACETMRYMVSRAVRGTCCASDIPPLLRRCAAVARVALRWGRAMHDAKLHLAYTLDNEGCLNLKVANIPLRSVWEVSMHVELVVDDAREAPWPRAGDVRVARVVSDVPVSDGDVRRALARTPRDWGHAPRTIWRMFRYLKHKTRDDDLLLGS